MQEECRWLSHRARAFKPSPIQKLTQLAEQRNAINLAEGFPDFPAHSEVKEAAREAILADLNQYNHIQAVCDNVAELFKAHQGIAVSPKTEVTICCGQTEAMAAAIFAVIDRDDEVILLEPVYETYASCITLAEGKPVPVPMKPPEWSLDASKLESCISRKTKAIVVNSPHNPTGKVFSQEELDYISMLCCKHDLLVLTDEVYEHVTFDGVVHRSLASLPGMRDRTIVTSSISKTYSVTGWRVGWAIAPRGISTAIRNIHIKLTDSAPSAFQFAAVTALRQPPEFYARLKLEYEERRNYMCQMLQAAGFQVTFRPQGSFFVFAKLPDQLEMNDVEIADTLIREAGIAVVPGRCFFSEATQIEDRLRYIRVAFCKSKQTLQAASTALTNFKMKINMVQSQITKEIR